MTGLRIQAGLFLAILISILCSCNSRQTIEFGWPEISHETKPWTRWWWHGNAVNKEEITRELEAFKNAGIGGVEVTPIFGVYPYEDQWIDFLSPEWVEMLTHTLQEAERLDLGVDMATGTGWPFGGPWINDNDASKYFAHQTYRLKAGETLSEPVIFDQNPVARIIGTNIYKDNERINLAETSRRPAIEDLKDPINLNENLQAIAPDQVRFPKSLPLHTLMGYSSEGEAIELTDKVNSDGKLQWTAPNGSWTLYAVFEGLHGKMVERAAPGGEGAVIDHFSSEALNNYLKKFDEAFQGTNIQSMRAFFNDSYEVDDAMGNADWTSDFFIEFQQRRGYDLKRHLPALFGDDSEETNRRVLTDYRETISDLLLERFTDVWREWSHEKSVVIRNQAHGSPANIIDLYAASDIPETEGREIFMFKLASSAAHLTGKRLASSEAATWLNEHFLSNWGDVKHAVDDFFLGGVNHNCYHGSAYSPDDEEWPGWLFYAAVHFNDRNPMWDDFRALNNYVARVQSFMQSGEPDNDLLLYYPVFDTYAQRANSRLHHYHEIERNFNGSSLQETCEGLFAKGYTFDFISDRLLSEVSYSDGTLNIGGGSYRAIVLPETGHIPVSTFEKIVDLAGKGATILIHKNLPADFTGFANLEINRNKFNDLQSRISLSTEKNGTREAVLGKGKIIVSNDINDALAYGKIKRETLTDADLRFERRKSDSGSIYFIVNKSTEAFDGWAPILYAEKSAVLFNPANGGFGVARSRDTEEGKEIYLQLVPGESCILQTYDRQVNGKSYPYYRAANAGLSLDGTWKIDFIKGGPQIPESYEGDLISWTRLDDPHAGAFSGTARYSITFPKPEGKADVWKLELGEVAETARVKLNGDDLDTLIGPNYDLYINNELMQDQNLLEVEVSNLMSNRIAFMDREGMFWKRFYNVNFPPRLAENRGDNGLFSAAKWNPAPSGLLGPVRLTGMEYLED